jgi:Trk-type K+ transport system membrane component
MASNLQRVVANMPTVGFFTLLTIWLLFWTFVGGAILLAVSPGIGYVNAAFLCTSAWGGTGLYSVEGGAISPHGFVVLYFIMYFGGTCTLLLPPMIFRWMSYATLRPELKEFLRTEGNSKKPIARSLVEVIDRCEMIHSALAMSILLVFMHNFFWLFFGTFITYGISTMYPDPPELISRGFGKLWSSTFLTASAFFNCGFVLTSDSLFQYIDKPGIFLWSTVLILAGNTFAPLCLRILFTLTHAFADLLRLDKAAIQFAMNNPRLITTHLFSLRQTIILTLFVISIDASEFIFFLASELNRPELQASPRPRPCPPRPGASRGVPPRRYTATRGRSSASATSSPSPRAVQACSWSTSAASIRREAVRGGSPPLDAAIQTWRE